VVSERLPEQMERPNPVASVAPDDGYWMLLDAGNSALKWVLVDGDGRVGPAHGSVRNGPPAEMLYTLGVEWRSRAPVDLNGAFALMRAVEQAARQSYGVPIEWFETQSRFEFGDIQLTNGYYDPAQLGVDRWHALIAARAAWPQRALVVVIAGTATTIDGVTREGLFVGGAIAPGVRMMFEALARGTANLPLATGTLVSYPDNTHDAITSGVIGAQLGVIERFARNFRNDHGEPQILLAGGYGDRLAPYVGIGTALPSVVREENLVLRGVLLRAQSVLQEADAPQAATMVR
jgi:type III pantothenate kinase